MKRIDPAEVAAWFKAHPDIRPVQEDFVVFTGETVIGCCGLSSQLEPENPRALRGMAEDEIYDLAVALGLYRTYACGFAKGWDDKLLIDDASPAYAHGHVDGRRAHEMTVASRA